MSEDVCVIDAGTVLTPFERLSPGRVILRGDTIQAAGTTTSLPVPPNAARIEGHELTVVPGFIEPHIHGHDGIDVMTAGPEGMATISRALARSGTTCFFPTTVSMPEPDLTNAVRTLATLLQYPYEGAHPAGIHMEGPFLNHSRHGAHSVDALLPPNVSSLARWIEASQGTLKLLTLAPELEGARAVAEFAQASRIAVAMGHSDASFAQAAEAIENGVRYAVHTFNAMRAFTHRDPGISGAVLADDRVFAEIIADGIHVDPHVIQIFARAKGRDRMMLVTDAMSAAGMPDGRYALGGGDVQVAGGVCRTAAGKLAGSTLTQDRALRNFVNWTGMDLGDALRGLTSNPAAALGLSDRGRIEPGARADLVMLDANLQVSKTIVGGEVIFERP